MFEDIVKRIKAIERELDILKSFDVPFKSPILFDLPLTNTAFDGDSFSTLAATALDISTFTNAAGSTVPPNARGVIVRLQSRDSAAWGTGDLYVAVGPTAAYFYQLTCRCFGGDVWNNASGLCACINRTIYYRVLASGGNTEDIYIQVLGYWL